MDLVRAANRIHNGTSKVEVSHDGQVLAKTRSRSRILGLDGNGVNLVDPTGLQLWLKADEITGLNNADRVTSWKDCSGNGHDLTASGNCATYITNAYNGLPAVRMDVGTTHALRLNSGTGLNMARNVAGMTVIVAARQTLGSASADGTLFFASTASGATSARIRLLSTGTMINAIGRRLDADNLATYSPTPLGFKHAIDTRPFVAAGVFDYANAQASVYQDKLLFGTGAFLTAGSTSDTASLSVSVGNIAGSGVPWAGDLLEILVYSRALSTAEIDAITEYLWAKWGILYTDEEKYGLAFSAVPNNLAAVADIDNEDVYPVMACARMYNEAGLLPRPIGYLYHKNNGTELLYSPGRPDRIAKLADWDLAVTHGGNSTPNDYMLFMASNGSVIGCVRGEFFDSDPTKARDNPVVYPVGDYANPVEVDFGEDPAPTGWLGVGGIAEDCSDGTIFFGEYTRPHHAHCYLWKVVPPYTAKENWTRVAEFDVGTVADTVAHIHTVNYDPFGDVWIMTTGDANAQVSVQMSTDGGATWTSVASGSQQYRLINFIFTEDYVYYANDTPNAPHVLCRVGRDVNGYPDFTDVTKLATLPYGQATYHTVYLRNPHGLLILDRDEGRTDDVIEVCFYSLEDNRLYKLGTVEPVDTVEVWGFRAVGGQLYQSDAHPGIVLGFSGWVNMLALLSNANTAAQRIRNLELTVVRL